MGKRLVRFSIDHPKPVTAVILLTALLIGMQFPKIRVDTDPENMLAETAFVRRFHHDVKKAFTLHDFIVLGIVNENHPNGVFTPETLGKIYKITKEIKEIEGVITYDLMSPSTTDNIRQGGLGTVRFERLMAKPPETMEQAVDIKNEAKDNPMLDGTLVSEDGRAIAIYVPIEKKDMSYRVAQEIKAIVSKYKGAERYHITGLPVAEDTFGVEMFKQMAISAPMAGLLIFLIMWYFFRKVTLIFSPMIVAVLSIVYSMGIMIWMGYTVHIMSSMIPIFLMPISVVDAVHILSQFFDKYKKSGSRRDTIIDVMDDLFKPMLYTSLTTAVGFASLAFTPIPPVRVFGIFIAFGVMMAWIFTMTFIPAYIMLMKESGFKNFGASDSEEMSGTFLKRMLAIIGILSYRRWKLILAGMLAVLVLSIIGITKIRINDNPVKWFVKGHPIRVADRVLNKHFGGTYTAYLTFKQETDKKGFVSTVKSISDRLAAFSDREGIAEPVFSSINQAVLSEEERYISEKRYIIGDFITELLIYAEEMADKADDASIEPWELLIEFIEDERLKAQPFKQPETLKYIEKVQAELLKTGIVGKSTSLADVVKKVYYELMEGDKRYSIIPATSSAVGQTLISFQNSHDPDDLWHFVTKDYTRTNIWVQLKSGDNKDMHRVVEHINAFLKKDPPPSGLAAGWGGLTYLNVVWQEKMVAGMLNSLLGSFVIVFLMMIVLYRSFLWGLLAMIPLSVTIALIYGLIGFAGKDYDMPIAVLSSLTLGLSIDFAIHFLEKARTIYKETGEWEATVKKLFEEPARAISRNAMIIAVGFLPLLAASLVPYKTVGFFMFSIMAVSGAVTLIILPALITAMRGRLFKNTLTVTL